MSGEPPFPPSVSNQWRRGVSPDVGREGFSRRLDQTRLRAAGRATIADQVAEAEALGIQAFGWLPSDHGPSPLATYAREQGVSTIVISADLQDVSGLEALLNGTNQPVGTLDAETPARVVVV
jgi:hypothetical protein